MGWYGAALVEALDWLRLTWVCWRRWAHELVDLVLVRGDRVRVDRVVNVGDVLRPVTHRLVELIRRLVPVAAEVFRRSRRLPLLVGVVWLSHRLILQAHWYIFQVFFSLLQRAVFSRTCRHIDQVVAGRLEAVVDVKHSLALALRTDLAAHALAIGSESRVALALSLHLAGPCERRGSRLREACIQGRLGVLYGVELRLHRGHSILLRSLGAALGPVVEPVLDR